MARPITPEQQRAIDEGARVDTVLDDDQLGLPPGCDYCDSAEHTIEQCPDFDADQRAAAEQDAATDKSEWPL